MTTGESEISGESVEQPQVESAENRTAEPAPQAKPRPWYRRASFWRAVIGMAIAIAFGWAAVASEIASNLSSHNRFLYHRIESLRAQISELRIEAVDAERRLATMRTELATGAEVNSVLSAPDLIVLPLRPPAGTDTRGLLAISKQAGTAIIELAGLPARTDKTCTIWWLLAEGAPLRAAELRPGPDGRLSSAIPMPTRAIRIAGAIITLEPGKPANQPKGRLVLRGVMPNPLVLS
jgi:hypothetical protein